MKILHVNKEKYNNNLKSYWFLCSVVLDGVFNKICNKHIRGVPIIIKISLSSLIFLFLTAFWLREVGFDKPTVFDIH